MAEPCVCMFHFRTTERISVRFGIVGSILRILRFDVLTGVKISIMVFGVMTPCSLYVVTKMKVIRSSESL